MQELILPMARSLWFDERLVELGPGQSKRFGPESPGSFLIVSFMKMQPKDKPSLSIVISADPGYEEAEHSRIGIGHLEASLTLGAFGPVEASARHPEWITELAAGERACVRSDPLDFLPPLSACVDRHVAPDTRGPSRLDRRNLLGTQPDL